ncbi:MAG: alpha/beta hydrolase [Actinomycetota bacterium]|nr:alpha/beta hydrolase [Actinomycetota bacterium]
MSDGTQRASGGLRSLGTLRKALIGAGIAVGAAAVGVAAERYAVRRARARPDPERGESLTERPGSERRVTSFDGTELAVNVIGPDGAPTLVFAHGITLDMTAWHFQWKDLSAEFRCVLYDQRGHGRSAKATDGDYSLEALGRDLKTVLDATGSDDPVVFVGHSMGGMSIVSFAELFPEEFGSRVKAVILANTAASDAMKEVLGGMAARVGKFLLPTPRRFLSKPERAFWVRSGALGLSPDIAFLVVRLTNFGSHASPSVVDHVASIAGQAPAEVWTDLIVSVAEINLAHALEHITVPTLVLVGDTDRLTPPASALAIKRKLPQGRMVVLRDAGHCAMLERHRLFNQAVRDFLGDVLQPASGVETDGQRASVPSRTRRAGARPARLRGATT